tara:strand:+ start:7357 stop:7668 length:312 start_codon:yes stop_codon:yes gene_type:complete
MDDYQELPEEKEEKEDEERPSKVGTLVQLIVLTWSLGVISMSYFGNTVKQIDTTFAAGLLSSVLGNFNIAVKKPGNAKPKDSNKPRKDPITGKNIGPDGRLIK